MILADVYDLLNDLFFESLRFIVLAALIVLAVVIGVKLRKKHDAKVATEAAAEVSNSEDTTEE